jgi:hypothetical protein
MTTRGRPIEVEDRKTLSFELGKPHREYIAAFINKIKASTGFHITQSAALRRILEEHATHTNADTSA